MNFFTNWKQVVEFVNFTGQSYKHRNMIMLKKVNGNKCIRIDLDYINDYICLTPEDAISYLNARYEF